MYAHGLYWPRLSTEFSISEAITGEPTKACTSCCIAHDIYTAKEPFWVRRTLEPYGQMSGRTDRQHH